MSSGKSGLSFILRAQVGIGNDNVGGSAERPADCDKPLPCLADPSPQLRENRRAMKHILSQHVRSP